MKQVFISMVGTLAGVAVGAVALAAATHAVDDTDPQATDGQAPDRQAADQQAGAGRLTLTVSNIESDQGALMIGVYAGSDAYAANDAVAALAAPVVGAELTSVFEGLAPGDYAIKVFHDVNSDGALNTNTFGMPTEPYGFSNDARGVMGPASYLDAKFSIGAGETAQTLRLGG